MNVNDLAVVGMWLKTVSHNESGYMKIGHFYSYLLHFRPFNRIIAEIRESIGLSIVTTRNYRYIRARMKIHKGYSVECIREQESCINKVKRVVIKSYDHYRIDYLPQNNDSIFNFTEIRKRFGYSLRPKERSTITSSSSNHSSHIYKSFIFKGTPDRKKLTQVFPINESPIFVIS